MLQNYQHLYFFLYYQIAENILSIHMDSLRVGHNVSIFPSTLYMCNDVFYLYLAIFCIEQHKCYLNRNETFFYFFAFLQNRMKTKTFNVHIFEIKDKVV